jgi:hypothetical protein
VRYSCVGAGWRPLLLVGETAGVFVVDDLVGWLVGRVADAGYQKLTTRLHGSDQPRALKQAVTAAVQGTVAALGFSGGEADRVAEQINRSFGRRVPVPMPPEQATVLEALQAGIAGQLSAGDDAGRPVVYLPGVPAGEVAAKLTGHLVREIQVRGSRGGPLAELADQLNHDLTHLQGQRLEGMLAQVLEWLGHGQASHGGAAGPQGWPLAEVGDPFALEVRGRPRNPEVTSKPTPARDPPMPVQLAPRPPMLAGRDDLLTMLHARLTEGGGDGPQIVALCGLGGVGKTSIALEYAHRHKATAGVIWQFPAEDPTVLAAEFTMLAAMIGGWGKDDPRDPVKLVHAVLRDSTAPWLLVFDNAKDQDSVRPFLPPAGNGRVLITSQNALWPPGQAMAVPVLDAEAAAGFLVARARDPDDQAAATLAEELGRLPLALEQAGAYIDATIGSLAGYLIAFRQRRAELLARGEPTGYRKTVATTWSLAFERVEQASQAAAGLLRLLGCCAAEPIPLRLLLDSGAASGRLPNLDVSAVLALLLDDRLAVQDAIHELRRYSLVSPAGDDLVLVHRLVQAITLDQMPAALAAQWRQAAAALIDSAIPHDTDSPETWPVCAALLPHVQVALAEDSDGMQKIADYLGNSGSYAAARAMHQKVCDARVRISGWEAERTLTARVSLADWTGRAGDPRRARDLLAELLSDYERVLGPEHEKTLVVRGQLASWTGQVGDRPKAHALWEDLLSLYERRFGPDDQRSLEARLEVANWTALVGNPAKARDLAAQVLPVYLRIYPGDLSILHARSLLASFTGLAGNPAKARDLYAELLADYERILGPDHPDTLALRGILVRFIGQAGDPAKARDLAAALLPDIERVFGPRNWATLIARGSVAQWTGYAGDPAKARDLVRALLPEYEGVLGPEQPNTLILRSQVAQWTANAGDLATARDLYAELVPVMRRVFGPFHPDARAASDTLASLRSLT